MIIIRLAGGLGNQLFQYACGRSLALQKQTALGLDRSFYGKHRWRRLARTGLDLLMPLTGKISWTAAKNKIRRDRRRYELDKFVLAPDVRYVRTDQRNVVRERDPYIFEPPLASARDEAIYEGYFNSEKYFLPIARELRKEISLKEKYSSRLPQSLITRMSVNNAVSVHIRRGDYVTKPAASRFHGVISLGYYHQAAKIMAERCPAPIFFIFSDDPDWCRAHLDLGPTTEFVTGNENHEDLILMSLCRHHIISNSTFAWWGAWLDSRPDKIVIAPSRWVADKEMRGGDLFPPEWLII